MDIMAWYTFSQDYFFFISMPNTLIQWLLLLVLVAFIGWRLWSRWKRAGNVSEADRSAMEEWKTGYQTFQNTPVYAKVKNYIDKNYTITNQEPADGKTYRLVYTTLLTEAGQPVSFDEVAKARFLVAYLKGASDRKQISLDLQTEQIHEQVLSGMAWSSVVPYWVNMNYDE